MLDFDLLLRIFAFFGIFSYLMQILVVLYLYKLCKILNVKEDI